MGRIKQGLDYFPLNTDFMHDRVVRRVMKREGDSAFTILLYTLSYLYSGEGYYIHVDNDFYDELSDQLFSTDNDSVRRVLHLFVEYGFFDSSLYERYGILTSADIQRQYLFITKRRSSALIEPDYCLLESEEITSYRSSQSGKSSTDDSLDSECAEALNGDADHKTACTVTSSSDSVTMEDEIATSGTQNKRKQIKINQNKVNHLPNPPQGGDEGGKYLKSRTAVTQEDIDCLQPPCDGVQRNFQGLTDNLRLYKVPPSEQYAIILKSNFGAIGNPVWKGFNTIRGSNGKIRLPGHYLLSIIN